MGEFNKRAKRIMGTSAEFHVIKIVGQSVGQQRMVYRVDSFQICRHVLKQHTAAADETSL